LFFCPASQSLITKTAWRDAMAVVTQPLPCRLLDAVLQTATIYLAAGLALPAPAVSFPNLLRPLPPRLHADASPAHHHFVGHQRNFRRKLTVRYGNAYGANARTIS
jgi:hypothetical protein